MTQESGITGAGKIRDITLGLLPVVLVAWLTRISVAQDLFSQVSRPIITGIIGLFHVPVADIGNSITVGRLEIPWTGDCAGLNLLVLLLAVAIWLNRHEPFNWVHWLRILGMIPSAILANVLRVFTLIGYREVFYPAVETPQLHYFFGFLWLVPFALISMPRSPRHLTARVFELIHVAAVIALLAPQTYGPGGLGLTLAVVLGLSHCHLPEQISKRRVFALVTWLIAAVVLAAAGMESFWLPWMIVCPLTFDSKWIFTPAGCILTVATHPLFALIPGAEIITWGAVAQVVWNRFISNRPESHDDDSHSLWTWKERSLLAGTSLLFLLPFLASTIFAGKMDRMLPPKIASSKTIPGDGFLVTMPGQPDQIGLLWYNASGTHRHHALEICLKYRGVNLEQSPDDSNIFTDGTHWFREFFLQGGKLIPSHLKYVISTLTPGSSAGVHLIYVTCLSFMSAREFDQKTQKMASELFETMRTEEEHRGPQLSRM